MKVFFLVIFSIFVLSLSINLFRLLLTCRYYKTFREEPSKLRCSGASVDRLWCKAGINKALASGRYAGERVSSFLADDYYGGEIDKLFCSAISVYKGRIKNTFNPLYWLEAPYIVVQTYFLKSKKSPAKLVKRLIGLVSWAIGIIAGHYLESFLESDAFHRMLEVCRSILK